MKMLNLENIEPFETAKGSVWRFSWKDFEEQLQALKQLRCRIYKIITQSTRPHCRIWMWG